MFGTPRHHYALIDSTNIRAKELALDGAAHGTLVTADFQTAGRGRFHRVWHSTRKDNILASFIVRPERDPSEWGGLPLLCGCAVAAAVAEVLARHGKRPMLKWPNDVLVEEKKVSGILVESGMGSAWPWAVLGIGINVNQTEFSGIFASTPTSLRQEIGGDQVPPIPVDGLLERLAKELNRLYSLWSESGNGPIITEWLSWSDFIGRSIRVQQEGQVLEGNVEGIQIDGSLCIRCADGSTVAVYAGDVTLRSTVEGRIA